MKRILLFCLSVIATTIRGRAGNHFPTLPFGTVHATFTAHGYWVVGPYHWQNY